MDKVQYNINVQNYLPHREPMLMVDNIVEIRPDKVITTFEIKENNIFLEEGYFPSSGLVEHIAQTSSTITGQELRSEIVHHKDPGSQVIGFITNIKRVKVFKRPKVGETLRSEAVLMSRFGEICTVLCTSFVEGEPTAEAEISLFIKAL